SCSEEEIDDLWAKLSEGGEVLMEFQEYPFSKKYGWCKDKFGVSWQLSIGQSLQKITPSLLFVGDKAGKTKEAIEYYSGLFDDSGTEMLAEYASGEGDIAGYIKFGSFKLAGQNFIAMDSSAQHKFTFNEAVSFYVSCEDQAEIDRLWAKLSAVPESEQCGWCKDKFGVSWQLVPKRFEELVKDPDQEKSKKVMEAMLKMHKIEVSELEKAYNS
ncbi:MAG: VOC family protein, partial [Nanoarchaeota archaeon]